CLEEWTPWRRAVTYPLSRSCFERGIAQQARLVKVRHKSNPLKETPLRNPGQSLDEELDRLLNEQLAILLIAPLMLWIWSAMEWFAKWRHAPRTPEIYALMALGVTVYCAWRITKLRHKI